MATKTYLELVNDVLVRLREEEVSTVDDSSYSVLIGKWVNDAKRMVEDAWDWEALSAAYPITIDSGVLSYAVDNLNERARLLRDPENPLLPLAFDTTAGEAMQLQDRPLNWVRKQRALENTPNNQARPTIFAVAKEAGAIRVYLLEIPTEQRTWNLYFIDPQDDLSEDQDVLSIPYSPVVQIALDYALNERGEEIGEPGTTVAQKAAIHIANAIAIDAQEQTHKVTFYPS